jgi:hypothetical protein
MKNLDDLTPEIKAQIPIWKERCTTNLFNGNEWKNYNRDITIEYVDYVYEMVEKETPITVVANSLIEFRKFYNFLFNDKINKNQKKEIETFYDVDRNKEEKYHFGIQIENKLRNSEIKKEDDEAPKFHWNALFSEYSRVYLTWYKFIKDMFKIPYAKEKELDFLYERVNESSIAKAFMCNGIVLILRMPKKIMKNEIGFHCTSNEGAIQYDDQHLYYINGRNIPSWVFEKYFSGNLKFKDFIKETDEDIKAGIIVLIKDNEGNEGLMKFLNAILVDEKEITHSNGKVETVRLYKTKEKYEMLQDHLGNTNVPYAWTWFKCPSTGTEYLIDTSSAFDNVLDSIKFHRPQNVPFELDYDWKTFSN